MRLPCPNIYEKLQHTLEGSFCPYCEREEYTSIIAGAMMDEGRARRYVAKNHPIDQFGNKKVSQASIEPKSNSNSRWIIAIVALLITGVIAKEGSEGFDALGRTVVLLIMWTGAIYLILFINKAD